MSLYSNFSAWRILCAPVENEIEIRCVSVCVCICVYLYGSAKDQIFRCCCSQAKNEPLKGTSKNVSNETIQHKISNNRVKLYSGEKEMVNHCFHCSPHRWDNTRFECSTHSTQHKRHRNNNEKKASKSQTEAITSFQHKLAYKYKNQQQQQQNLRKAFVLTIFAPIRSNNAK